MKKIIMAIFAGVLVMPQLCESYVSMKAEIEKGHVNDVKATGGRNEHKSDSVYMDYDDTTNTITISTPTDGKEVDVQIYKDGVLIYADNDSVSDESYLNYTLSDDEEAGEYDVYVSVENGGSIEATITKE